MKWIKLKTKLNKDKKDKKFKRIAQIKGTTFMVETEINKTTRRFNKVDIDLGELNRLKKQKYVK